LRPPTPAYPSQSPNEEAMKQPPTKFVFHEQEVSGVTFRAMVETGRVVLHMANSGGRESSVDLIGEAFALPCLCYCRRWLAAPRNAFRTAGLGCLPRHGAR